MKDEIEIYRELGFYLNGEGFKEHVIRKYSFSRCLFYLNGEGFKALTSNLLLKCKGLRFI